MDNGQLRFAGVEPLDELSKDRGELGNLVNAFLDSQTSGSDNWLGKWFLSRTQKHYAESSSSTLPRPNSVPGNSDTSPIVRPMRLKSVRIHNFRGFRSETDEIDLEGNLVVIYGKNSSGKTSLAEALEWLLSGSLSRRENEFTTNVRELAQCIANRHRQSDDDTWVEATLAPISEGDETGNLVLRRVLKSDYGSSLKATCSSVLFLNDQELNADEEKQALAKYFAGVPPLLMQHTLRDFVIGESRWRRKYFESLLRLDSITEIIQHAVVSDVRIDEYLSPNESRYLSLWEKLGQRLTNSSSRRSFARQTDRATNASPTTISATLSSISKSEFPSLIDDLDNKGEIITALLNEQQDALRNSLPVLELLQPQKRTSDDSQLLLSSTDINLLIQNVRRAWTAYEPTLIANQSLSPEHLAVSEAFDLLLRKGIVQISQEVQPCPLCAYDHEDTLTASRVSTIETWNSIRASELKARQSIIQSMDSMSRVAAQSLRDFEDLLPGLPSDLEWKTAMEGVGETLRKEAESLRTILKKRHDELSPFVDRARKLARAESLHLIDAEQCEQFIGNVATIVRGLSGVPRMAKAYCSSLSSLEDAVGREASTEPEYRLRECILECYNDTSSIVDDLRWEHAKRLTQQELEQIRVSLMSFRQAFLDSRRISFNRGIKAVWTSLRDDGFSTFNQLYIPRPKGRGFPVEIALKARIADSEKEIEVDALSVFSESQINALGIAAFVTRSRMLGHKILIFDDPVQSMDEDHFKSFARDLIPEMLDDDTQILILTHNDTFASDISLHHNELLGYVTMETFHSKRKGVYVSEGNRTVPQRLKSAEKQIDNGNFEPAWTNIRVAIERLYLVVYKKYGPTNFEPSSWQNLSAEDMWNKGAREVILEKVPDCELKLKEILTMASDGPHDKPTKGATDARYSVKFLRELMRKLRVGG